jgi:hypothetical protein
MAYQWRHYQKQQAVVIENILFQEQNNRIIIDIQRVTHVSHNSFTYGKVFDTFKHHEVYLQIFKYTDDFTSGTTNAVAPWHVVII